MLKITIHDSAVELTLRLEGRLAGPWVQELRQCWVTAASTTGGRSTVLDLGEVDFIDPEGQSLLSEMGAAGVKMAVSTPLIQSMVQSLSLAPGCVRVERKPARSRDAVLRPLSTGSHPGTL